MSRTFHSVAIVLTLVLLSGFVVFSSFFISSSEWEKRSSDLSERMTDLERQIDRLEQLLLERRQSETGDSPSLSSPLSPSPKTHRTEDEQLSEEERRMAEALKTDPDFKRVHDHLTRESPARLNIPAPLDQEGEGPVKPMSERPPVQFALPE